MDEPSSPQSLPTGHTRSEAQGVAAITLASFGFSWGFIIVRAVGLPAAWTALLRVALGAAALAVVTRLLGQRLRWSPPVLMAGLAFGLHQLLFIEATKTTSIALVTLIGALQPLAVALISRRAVGERVPGLLWVCGVLAVGGVGAVVFANRAHPTTSAYGIGLCVLNLLAFTAFFLASKRARQQGVHPVPLTAASLSLALVPIVPLLWRAPPASIESWQVGLLALMAWVPGNGHLLVNWAHPRVSAALSSIVLALVPIFASVWAHLIFDEPYGPLHVVGTVLCLLAIELGRRATSQ